MIGDTLFFSPMGLTKGVPLQGQGLYSFGVEPDVYLNFAAGYNKAGGVIGPVANQLTCVRASTRYINDVSGNWTLVGANLSGISNKGLLVEEGRTNSLRNNSAQGAAVGTPGTYPTFWLQSNNIGFAANVIATGVDSGIDYIDMRLVGTTAGGAAFNLFFDGINTIAAASGQVWSTALFYKLTAGSMNNVASITGAIQATNGAAQTEAFVGSAITPTASWQRALVENKQLANAGTTNIRSMLTVNMLAAPVAVDITLRIGWPQLEQGAWATSPIRTTAAAATRAADVVSLTSLPTFGGAYSLYAAGTPNSPTTALNQWLLVGVAGPNSAAVGRSLAGGGGQSHVLMTGGIDSTGAVWNPLAAGKLAAAFAVNDQVGVFNGGTPFTVGGTTGTPSVPTSVQLGSASSAQWWSGYITEAALWASARLTNAQLQAGTT